MSDDAVFMYYINRIIRSFDSLMAWRIIFLTDDPRKSFGEVVVYQSFKLPGFYRK